MVWPDVVALLVVGFATWRGWMNGLLGEVMGLVAMAASAFAAFFYGGQFDVWMADRTHLGPAPAHALGLAAWCGVVYAIITAIGFALRNVAKLPVLKQLNTLGGALVGAAKWTTFLWLALYIGLFFPLGDDVRESLHNSIAVTLLQIPNPALDTTIRNMLPAVVAPYAGPIFDHHHV